jgi:DNA-directed RNA polymerase subunit RPC12/RpoP
MSEESSTTIECPYCRSVETQLSSLFGAQLLTAQYYCQGCATPFERILGEDVLEDIARETSKTPPYP